MKKILSVILIAVLTISIMACGSSSKALIGKWELNSDQTEWGGDIPRFPDFEFFSDGTYASTISGYSGSYTVEGSRLRLSGNSRVDLTFDYTINGDTLVLDDGSSNHFVYSKAK